MDRHWPWVSLHVGLSLLRHQSLQGQGDGLTQDIGQGTGCCEYERGGLEWVPGLLLCKRTMGVPKDMERFPHTLLPCRRTMKQILGGNWELHLVCICFFVRLFFFFLMFEACSHYSDLAGLCRILYRCCSYLVEMEAMAESWQKSGKTWNMVTGLLCCWIFKAHVQCKKKKKKKSSAIALFVCFFVHSFNKYLWKSYYVSNVNCPHSWGQGREQSRHVCIISRLSIHLGEAAINEWWCVL